jgi:antitoxin component of RelBE/YafQ-DinJ toxin-antitoxin module
MTTVTLKTDEELLAKARKVLKKRGQTLDTFFRQSLCV